jgi:hypothetical protein
LARPPKPNSSTSHEDYDVLYEDEKPRKAKPAGPLVKAFQALFLGLVVVAIIAVVILAMIAFGHGG